MEPPWRLQQISGRRALCMADRAWLATAAGGIGPGRNRAKAAKIGVGVFPAPLSAQIFCDGSRMEDWLLEESDELGCGHCCCAQLSVH